MATRCFKIRVDKAEELLENPYSCVEKVCSERRFLLPVGYVNKVYKGICKHFENETGKYSDKLGGIVLSFDNVKMPKSYTNIIEDLPYISVDASADFIVFKPNVGSTMSGIVTKTSSFYISCLVHGCFNVSIQKSSDYVLFESAHLGNSVVLEVVSVEYNAHLVHIKGKLLRILEEELNEDTTVKADHRYFNDETDENVNELTSDCALPLDKQTQFDEILKNEFVKDETFSSTRSEHKKKKKKSKDETKEVKRKRMDSPSEDARHKKKRKSSKDDTDEGLHANEQRKHKKRKKEKKSKKESHKHKHKS